MAPSLSAAGLEALRVIDCETPAEWYAGEVLSGDATALEILILGEVVCYVVYRIEADADGREFVIVAAAALRGDLSLFETVLPLLERFAKQMGCQSLRFHTKRRGVIHKAERAGYGVPEYVLRKGLE